MAVVGDPRRIRRVQRPHSSNSLAGAKFRSIRASPLLRQIRAPFSQDLYVGSFAQQHRDPRQHCRSVSRLAFDPHLVRHRRPSVGTRDGRLAEIEEQLKSVASPTRPHPALFTNLVQATSAPICADRQAGHPRRDLLQIRSAQIEDCRRHGRFTRFSSIRGVEGIHLARQGGARRPALGRPAAGFHTEILGLVKAQQVKNAVIVPVGAKGGFVPKRLRRPPIAMPGWRKAPKPIGIFIRSLLELTDNSMVTRSCRPGHVRHDGDDPISSSPPTRALHLFDNPPMRFSPRRAIGSAMLSPPRQPGL